MKRTIERVTFRLIRTPCCGALLCWINPRLPNYCPECGKVVLPTIREGILRTIEAELVLYDNLPSN